MPTQLSINTLNVWVWLRMFVWGARSGVEQLPPFPEPSHEATKWRHTVPVSVKGLCVVDFNSNASRRDALLVVSLPWLSQSSLSSHFCCSQVAAMIMQNRRPFLSLLMKPPNGVTQCVSLSRVCVSWTLKAMQLAVMLCQW